MGSKVCQTVTNSIWYILNCLLSKNITLIDIILKITKYSHINSSYLKFLLFLCKFCMSSDIAVNNLSGKLQNLEGTIDEQKVKLTEYERIILETEGRIF